MNISEFLNTDKPLNIRVHEVLITLTKETILKTNKHLADQEQRCIDEGLSGEVYINPEMFDTWLEGCKNKKQEYLDNDFELWLGYYQTAYYIQTGESVPLLS